MNEKILELFTDCNLIQKIQRKLPQLFQIADLENQRGGKTGMEVGFDRERILVSLLFYYFGEKNVNSNLSTTEHELDVIVYDEPISIKTITSKSLGGVKISWTVEEISAEEFKNNYEPSCHILLTQINWEKIGYLYFIPINVQKEVIEALGKDRYIKLPPRATNPRGSEIFQEALMTLVSHPETKKIEILWKKEKVMINQYSRWIELWTQD